MFRDNKIDGEMGVLGGKERDSKCKGKAGQVAGL